MDKEDRCPFSYRAAASSSLRVASCEPRYLRSPHVSSFLPLQALFVLCSSIGIKGIIAAEARADWARTATERARRAAVMVTAPVGLCFLPAFIAVGVAPVVIGLAGGVLGGGGG